MHYPSLAVLVCIATLACEREQDHGGESPTATAEGSPSAQAYEAVRQRGALLLDVRTRPEFEAERIDGAHNIPVEEIDSRLAEVADLARGREHPVVVYSSSDARSAHAKAELVRGGFRIVIDAGGLRDWPVRTEIRRGGAR